MSAGHALGHQTLPRHFYLPRGKHACFFLGIPNRCRRSEGDPKLCQRPLINRSSRAFLWAVLCSPSLLPAVPVKRVGASESSPPHCIKKDPESTQSTPGCRPEAQPGSAPRAARRTSGAPASRTEGKAKQGTQHQPKQARRPRRERRRCLGRRACSFCCTSSPRRSGGGSATRSIKKA